MNAREFLEEWYGIELQNYHEGDADVEIASYLYDDISNGDIGELLKIMENYGELCANKYHESCGKGWEE